MKFHDVGVKSLANLDGHLALEQGLGTKYCLKAHLIHRRTDGCADNGNAVENRLLRLGIQTNHSAQIATKVSHVHARQLMQIIFKCSLHGHFPL